MGFKRWGARALAGASVVPLAFAFGVGATHVHADDSYYECQQHGGHQVVLRVNHNDGSITTSPTIQGAISAAATNTTAPSSTGSGAGDTVIVCQGTYHENITIGAANDNLTVRSENGAGPAAIVGDGTAPVVTIDDRGLSFGGPGEGFLISISATSGTAFTGIQEGVPGAQATTNEDEQCTTNPGGVTTSSGCDSAAPADVTINDQIIGNVFSNFHVPSAAAVTGIKLDNTINSTVQQNLFQNVIPDHSSVASFAGIVIGGFNESTASPPTGYTTGDSTNINTALFQNALVNVFQGGNSGCGTAQGIELNGFLLDAQVYNNWVQQLLSNSASTCAVTGIFSNAYGSLENEQTGTIAPVNANIDNNTIQQIGPNGSTKSEGIVLAPTPANATPGPQAPPSTCLPQAGENCKDTIPPSSYTVVQNEIQQVYRAVHDESVLGANSYIRFNNFDQDVIGVQNDAAAPANPAQQNTSLDATNNWWGCELQGRAGPPTTTTGSNHGCAALIDAAATMSAPYGDTSWAPPQTNRVSGAGDDAGNNAGAH